VDAARDAELLVRLVARRVRGETAGLGDGSVIFAGHRVVSTRRLCARWQTEALSGGPSNSCPPTVSRRPVHGVGRHRLVVGPGAAGGAGSGHRHRPARLPVPGATTAWRCTPATCRAMPAGSAGASTSSSPSCPTCQRGARLPAPRRPRYEPRHASTEAARYDGPRPGRPGRRRPAAPRRVGAPRVGGTRTTPGRRARESGFGPLVRHEDDEGTCGHRGQAVAHRSQLGYGMSGSSAGGPGQLESGGSTYPRRRSCSTSTDPGGLGLPACSCLAGGSDSVRDPAVVVCASTGRIGMSGGLFLSALQRETGVTSTPRPDAAVDVHREGYLSRAGSVVPLPALANCCGRSATTRRVRHRHQLGAEGRRSGPGPAELPDHVPVVTRDLVERAKPTPTCSWPRPNACTSAPPGPSWWATASGTSSLPSGRALSA